MRSGWVPAKVSRGSFLLASSSSDEQEEENARGRKVRVNEGRARCRSSSRLRDLATALEDVSNLLPPAPVLTTARLTLEASSGAHALVSIVQQVRVRVLASALRHWLTRPVLARSGAVRTKLASIAREKELLRFASRVVSAVSGSGTIVGLREFIFRLKMKDQHDKSEDQRRLRQLMGMYLVTSAVDKITQRILFSAFFRYIKFLRDN